jgi:hypothetical protein
MFHARISESIGQLEQMAAASELVSEEATGFAQEKSSRVVVVPSDVQRATKFIICFRHLLITML